MTKSQDYDKINPYASPQVLDPRQRADVGAWRSGPLLVMHIQANLPRVCIVTGEAAAGAFEWHLIWKPPGALASRQTILYLPLNRDLLDRFARARARFRLALLLAAVGAFFLLPFSFTSFAGDYMLAVWLLAAALMVAGIIQLSLAFAMTDEPLELVRSEGNYLWLSGANERFLALLPPANTE